MFNWENNILGFVPKQDWLDIPFRVQRPNDPADVLFSDRKTANIMAEWQTIADEYRIPVMAQFHGFDTEAQTTVRFPVDSHNIEKGLIKVKINQSESMRAHLRSGVQGDEALYDYVINDGVRLAEQVITRTKVAKNELLSTGQVTIKENGIDLVIDYGVPQENVGLTLDMGAGAEADVVSQIQNIIDTAREGGTVINGIYTRRHVVNRLRQNAAIQGMINGNIGVGRTVALSDFRDFLSDEFGINTVLENDDVYGERMDVDVSGRPHVVMEHYYPDNTITFFGTAANGRVGVGLWGDPPEADVPQLLDVSKSGKSPYVYITQWSENDPAVLWTKASTLFVPVLYNPTGLFIATVSDGTGVTVGPPEPSEGGTIGSGSGK